MGCRPHHLTCCRAAKLEIGGRHAFELNFNYVVEFLSSFDSRQTKHAPREFRRVVDSFYKFVLDADKVGIAVWLGEKVLMP